MRFLVGFLSAAALLSVAFALSCTNPAIPDARCKAFASLQVVATDGRCSGSAGASCTVWTQSQNVYKDEVVSWLGMPGQDLCKGSTVRGRARAIATAIAKVWTSSFVKYNCPGGFGCGWTLSDGEGLGSALAEALVIAVADSAEAGAIGRNVAESFCYADIRAIGGSIARAAASTQASTCVKNENASKYEKSFAQAIQRTIATALARATVKICDTTTTTPTGTSGDVTANSECSGQGTVNRVTPNTINTGDSCATASKVNLCKGIGSEICCTTQRKSVCTFTTRQRQTCGKQCGRPWIRTVNKGNSVFYKQTNGEECLCDPLLI